jgi:3-dehydroquinate synthase
MKTLKVQLSTEHHKYDVLVGPGLLENSGSLLTDYGYTSKSIIITDSHVNKIYGSILQQSLLSYGFDVNILEIPAGEASKSLDTAARLYTELTNVKAERSTIILALGGGVTGDLAGFVAATYLRGIPLIQIPTTILAQCDSSIGGKVAVNHAQLKNKIGTFYHPKLVISDINTLKTLSARELSDGLAEVIKYGIILDIHFFDFLETSMDKLRSLDFLTLETIVTRSIENKARIIEKDEFDRELRNVLNYGHTIGHAIESASEMTIWHGEAVAIGMIAEAKLANKLGMLSELEVTRITEVIAAAGLPTNTQLEMSDKLLGLMQHDKKVNQGKIRFALPQGLGKVALVDDIPIDLIKQVLGNEP